MLRVIYVQWYRTQLDLPPQTAPCMYAKDLFYFNDFQMWVRHTKARTDARKYLLCSHGFYRPRQKKTELAQRYRWVGGHVEKICYAGSLD